MEWMGSRKPLVQEITEAQVFLRAGRGEGRDKW